MGELGCNGLHISQKYVGLQPESTKYKTPTHLPINPHLLHKIQEQLVLNMFLLLMCNSLSHYKWSDLRIIYYS